MKQHNLHFAVRVVCCILLLTLAYVLQSSLGVRVFIFGVHIDILPLIVAAVGIESHLVEIREFSLDGSRLVGFLLEFCKD